MDSIKRKISVRLLRKGAFIDETYMIFQQWDTDKTIKENLRHVQEHNVVGADNLAWLKEIVSTLSSRFIDEKTIEPLILLAKHHVALEIWKPCLLWHLGSIDALYYAFATQWLFEAHKEGKLGLRTEDVVPFVRHITEGILATEKKLSEYGTKRVGRDMLRMASDFGLLTGKAIREFVPYHIPEESFLYVLHAVAEREFNANQIVQSLDWCLFLMYPDDVERELLRLHQYRKLDYQVAGSLAQLRLNHQTLIDFVKAWIS